MNYKYNGSYGNINVEEKPQANNIADWIKEVVSPKKVIDIGCGPGTYVYSMRNKGLNSFGYDLDERVDGKKFLTRKSIFDIEDNADMLICMEVAEHIPAQFSQKIVDKLVGMLDNAGILLFTAGHIGQGGVDHINCRPKEYWEHLFTKKSLIRCPTLENQLQLYIKRSNYMGWLLTNFMIFYKDDPSSNNFEAGSLITK